MKQTAKPSRQMTPRAFRILLTLALFLLLGTSVGIFAFGYTQISSMADEVSRKQADADASADSLSSLQLLQSRLTQYRDVPAILESLTAKGELPQFTAVNTLQTISGRYGIPISNISFAETPSAAGTAQAPAPAATQPPVPTQGSAPAATTSTASLSTVQVSFQIERAITFTTYLNFLHAIENASPKMQIESVSLPSGSSRGSVIPGQLIVKLYTA